MEKLTPPDLIVVDGGVHQVTTTGKVLKSLNLDIPYIGLVKSSDHKTSHILDAEGTSYELPKTGMLFRLLASMQDEVHRFTITFHQHLRGKAVFESILDGIEGVGEQTKKKLLETFKTIDNIAQASPEALKKLGIPQPTIERIHAYLNTPKETS
jgi:excinuclease ABC subunit C